MSTIILLRHGESEDTAKNIISGQRDVPLTDNGRNQAEEAAWKIARLGIKRIISSDLARARDTAKIIARELGLPDPETDSRLRELGRIPGPAAGNNAAFYP
jgi:probable phosphoglycerate mutase